MCLTRLSSFFMFCMMFLIGCGGSGETTPPTPPPPTPPPPAPTISISASSETISINTEFTLSWSSTNAVSCTASDDWRGSKPTSGSELVTGTQAGIKLYTVSCEGEGGEASSSVDVQIVSDDETGQWDYINVAYGSDDPNRQWLNIHLSYDQTTPSPIYLFAHGNGGTAYGMSEKQLHTIAAAGYAAISWESIPSIGNPEEVEIGVADADAMFNWVRTNAETYNLDPNHIVVGGRSRGSIISWHLAHSNDPSIKGIYMYNALPESTWQNVDIWNPVDEITINSPIAYLVYGPDFDDDDGHNPVYVDPVLERYDELGIGDKMTRHVDMWGDFKGGSSSGDWTNDGEIMHYFPEFVSSLTRTSAIVNVQRTAEQIDFVDKEEIEILGLNFESDFYRNYAYECGLSGNYTFMVLNPAGGDENTEAPLWVYAHGGNAGYYDDNGNYIAGATQDENTWNHEESFADLQWHLSIRSLNDDGESNNTTLPRRIEEGYRILVLALCDHDHYSGLGTPYPNNPLPEREVNGMQATMAAVEYTTANYPTTHAWAHGTSAGSLGVYNLAISFASENIFLTGVIADHVVATPRTLETLPPYVGMDGSPFDVGFAPETYNEKVGLFGNLDNNLHAEAKIPAGFDEVPIFFMGGRHDPFCHGNFPAVPAAAVMGLNNCEYAYDGIGQVVAAQPNSPHQVTLFDGGHVPSIKKQDASEAVDAFIDKVLATNPQYPFSENFGVIAGDKMMLMGHSFFRPFADTLPYHAERAGVEGHTQSVEFSGGESGSPLSLWEDPEHRANVQAVLNSGDVDVFGMTCCDWELTPEGERVLDPEGNPILSLEGWQIWFDYALTQNPDSEFFIGIPWLNFPTDYTDAEAYADTWLLFYNTMVLPAVDDLRALYPGVTIYTIPYGEGVIELRKMFEAGNLLDITNLEGPSDTSLFTDYIGHGGQLLKDLVEYIWIDAIYGVNLETYDYEDGYQTNLKAIAKSIMDAHNPNYNGPNR